MRGSARPRQEKGKGKLPEVPLRKSKTGKGEAFSKGENDFAIL